MRSIFFTKRNQTQLALNLNQILIIVQTLYRINVNYLLYLKNCETSIDRKRASTTVSHASWCIILLYVKVKFFPSLIHYSLDVFLGILPRCLIHMHDIERVICNRLVGVARFPFFWLSFYLLLCCICVNRRILWIGENYLLPFLKVF